MTKVEELVEVYIEMKKRDLKTFDVSKAAKLIAEVSNLNPEDKREFDARLALAESKGE